ncbi:hypothetical protein OG474_41695 [Kribbella sp. NBC_01505]|uniref:hypothetical protein n=1 Tax=Kribbella sp. NBC_01505 TaxID=2903580 RepID=UPI00386F1130
MTSIPLLALGVLVVLAVVLGVPVVTVPEGPSGQGAGWRIAGLVAGVVAAGAIAASAPLGQGLLLSAPVFGVMVMVGVVLGEFRRQPVGPIRSAAVETRRLRDYVPRRSAFIVGIATVVLTGILIWTTALGSPDDLGRDGRVLSRVCGEVSRSKGPWPGSYYAVPLGLLVLLGLLVAAVGGWRLVARPRPLNRAARPIRDDASRRRSAVALTGACGVVVAVPLAGISAVAGPTLLSMPCAPTAWTVGGGLLVLLIPCSLVLLAWSLVAILRPTRTSA